MAQQRYDSILHKARPFVKWAGGKRQLAEQLAGHMPERFGAYYEPFVGGGAMMFHVLAENPRQKCTASDLNSDLVLTYVTVRDRPSELVSSLRAHARSYERDPSAYYYAVRASSPRSQVAKASRLIFLNRTCFNGLYRVNGSGKFNVPLGRYVRPNIVNEENIMAVSSMLRLPGVQIQCADFESASRRAGAEDLVYFDPPYQPESKTASFTSYTRADFGASDLRRLADACKRLGEKGCYVMASNSDTPQVRAAFGRGWKISRVKASRSINSDSTRRTGHAELIIRNY